MSDAKIDNNVLKISRVSTVVILISCAFFAQALLNKNVALIVWIGIGGMMAAFSGPLIIGALWRGVTRRGAYAGLISGMGTFIILHAQLLDPLWFEYSSVVQNITGWLIKQGPNPFACTFLGEIVSVFTTILVSKFSAKLPREHLDQMF